MRHDYSTEQFQAFRQEVRESFWGQVRWRTQHALEQMLDADSEQQTAEYLGLAKYERTEDHRSGWAAATGSTNGTNAACEKLLQVIGVYNIETQLGISDTTVENFRGIDQLIKGTTIHFIRHQGDALRLGGTDFLAPH